MTAKSAAALPPRLAMDDPLSLNKVGSARSLEGLHGSIAVPHSAAGFWRHWRAFVGPAFLVSVGYMDPGNWATDLKAGAAFRYELLWVVALSSLMAIVLQVIAARLGVVTGKDLAQACRDYYWPWTRWPLWIACEVAIGACDLAEVLGSAIAITLLFPHIGLLTAVFITAFDVLLLLALQGLGMRFIEAVILVLVGTIGGCYFIELFVLPQVQPDFAEMGQALMTPGFRQEGMIMVAIGIIGATVMPHNLYLHSALVQSRQLRADESFVRRAIKFNTIDTVAALSVAFLVNAGILVLAAMVFHKQIEFDEDTDWIKVAYFTLSPLLGTALASTLFAVALLASGQSSTITGTLAGQVVMEGFMHWRVRPWVRRFMTRLLAIIPAIIVIGVYGDENVTDMLIVSQVVLAFQLPFAMIPLMHFTSTRSRMGNHANGWLLLCAGWTSCILITALAVYGILEYFGLTDAFDEALKGMI
ncbi:MAG TPA: Nramp family divalent metal transporter [Gemmataceae bacterium]|nr:Nramp family divalent metal transporter [Gemmataceae bacterium]